MAKGWSPKSNKSGKPFRGDDRDQTEPVEPEPSRGEGEVNLPWARRVRRIRGSEIKEVRRIRKRRLGKKRDWKNGGRSTRRPDGSVDFPIQSKMLFMIVVKGLS